VVGLVVFVADNLEQLVDARRQLVMVLDGDPKFVVTKCVGDGLVRKRVAVVRRRSCMVSVAVRSELFQVLHEH